MSKANSPRAEPEIIPPDDGSRGKSYEQAFAYRRGAEPIYVARIEPFGFIIVGLIVTLLLFVLFALMLATLVIWLPLLIFFVGGIIIGRIITGILFSR